VLLTAFAVVEGRRRAPLFPLSLLRNRPRSAAYLAMLAWGIAIVSAFLFLSFFLQDVLGYGAARADLAFLPYPLAIQLGVRVVRRRMTQLQARTLLTPGLGSHRRRAVPTQPADGGRVLSA
jgi:predicted MFS family arabinose efflux permease